MSMPNEPTWSGSSPPYATTDEREGTLANGGPNGGSTGTTTDVAREAAAGVARSASDAAQQVGSTAKEQVAVVASDVKEQGQRLAGEARQQLTEQATTQRDRAAKTIRAVGQELQAMADNSEQSGLGTQLVRQVASNSHQVASYLESREPSELLDELRAFARRRPGTFLLGAVVAGVVAGRLTRGIKSVNSSSGSSSQGQAAQPVITDYPASTAYLPPVGSDPGYRPAGATPVADSLVPPAPLSEPYGSAAGSYPTEEFAADWSQPAAPPVPDQGPGPVTR